MNRSLLIMQPRAVSCPAQNSRQRSFLLEIKAHLGSVCALEPPEACRLWGMGQATK